MRDLLPPPWFCLGSIGPLTCAQTSFITPPLLSTRFASTAALQFHSILPSLQNLVTYLQHKACASADEDCLRRVAGLLVADSVDVNYDSISHALTISGYWSRTPPKGWTEEVRAREAGKGQIEVGLLGTEKAIEPEEIQMGGVLAVVGKEDELSRLHFSSRHFVGGRTQANYICEPARTHVVFLPISTSPPSG